VGLDTGIGLDGAGKPRISYYDNTADNLLYARLVLGAWQLLPVDNSLNNVGGYSSLAIDASGVPHFSYHEGTTHHTMYAFGPAEVVGVVDPPANGPHTSAGLSAFPNPSRGEAVRIRLAEPGRRAVAFEILDVRGRRERRLAASASSEVTWDGRDERGLPVRPGIHFLRAILDDGAVRQGRRIVVVR
jgi:hypothetical protein